MLVVSYIFKKERLHIHIPRLRKILQNREYLSYCIHRPIFLTKSFFLVYSWILSRTRQLPQSAQIEVNRVINSILYLNNAYYEQADQSDDGCFYFPEPSPDEVVEFRNQCDDTIPVVSNFNIAAVGIFIYLPHILCKKDTFDSKECSSVFQMYFFSCV